VPLMIAFTSRGEYQDHFTNAVLMVTTNLNEMQQLPGEANLWRLAEMSKRAEGVLRAIDCLPPVVDRHHAQS
jgi:hypothetical protein